MYPLKSSLLILLALFYAAVGLMVLHPRVSPTYAAHYIHRSTDCWLPPALRGRQLPRPGDTIEIGRLGYPDACRYLQLNWHKLEAWGAWAGSSPVILHIPAGPGSAAVDVTFRGAPVAGTTVHTRFSDGHRSFEVDFPPNSLRTLRFAIDPGAPAHGIDITVTSKDRAALPPVPPEVAIRYTTVGIVRLHYLPATALDALHVSAATDAPPR